jgi:hypothetical protein
MKKILSLALCLSSFLTYSQIDIVNRIELPREKEYDRIFFEPIGEKGILQLAVEDDRREDLLKVRVQTYDSNLTFISEDMLKIENEVFELREMEFIEGKLHINLEDDAELLRYVIYDPLTGDTTQLDYTAQRKNRGLFTRFHRNKLYIFESSKKLINLVIWDLETGEQFKRPLKPRDVKTKHFGIEGVYFPDSELDLDDIFILGRLRIGRRNYINKLYRLHPDGIMDETLITNSQLPNVEDLSILQVPNTDRFLVFGSYGERGRTSGLFLGQMEKEEFQLIQRYGFGEDFDSLMTSMPKFSQMWQKWRKRRAHKKGEEFELDLLTTSHPILQLEDGGFLWVTELYQPTYRQVPTAGANGTTTYTQVFDGYQTTHAVLARINSDGQMVWDRAFNVLPLEKPYRVKRFLTIEFDEQQINFIYQRGRYLQDRAYDYDGNKVYQSEEMQLLTDEDERTSHGSILTMSKWYGPYLVAYGYQRIKNKEDRDKSRKVYSINKLRIQSGK